MWNKGEILKTYCYYYWKARNEGHEDGSHQAYKDYAYDQAVFACGFASDEYSKWLDNVDWQL